MGTRPIEIEMIGLLRDALAQHDQLAPHIHLVDRAAVISSIDDGNDTGGKIGQVLGAAHMLEFLVTLEMIFQGHRTGALAAFYKLHNGAIDTLMGRDKEMMGPQKSMTCSRAWLLIKRPPRSPCSASKFRRLPVIQLVIQSAGRCLPGGRLDICICNHETRLRCFTIWRPVFVHGKTCESGEKCSGKTGCAFRLDVNIRLGRTQRPLFQIVAARIIKVLPAPFSMV